MIRSILAIGILFCSFLPLYSQSTIVWGPEFEEENKILALLTSDDSHFYAIGGPADKPTLMKFDLKGKLTTKTLINITSGGAKEMQYYDVIHTAGHDYAIFLNRDKKAEKATYYAAEVKNGTLSPLKTFHTLPFGFTYGTGLGPAMPYDESAFSGSFAWSPDKKTIATFGSDIGHYADQIIDVVVFNESLEVTRKQSHAVKLPNRQVDVLDLAVNNAGEVYVVVKKWQKLNDAYMGDKPVDYALYHFAASGVKEHALKLDQSRFPVEVALAIGAQDEVAIVGTYRTLDIDIKNSLGIFYASVNQSGTLTSKTFPYTADVLSALGFTSEELKTKALGSINIQDLGVLPNGDIYFTALKHVFSSIGSIGTSYSLTLSGRMPGTYSISVSGQMLVSFPSSGASVQVSYLQQPSYLKNNIHASNCYSYQKDAGVVFVTNYAKVPLTDKTIAKAPLYTSVCYLEHNKPKQCTDIANLAEKESTVYPKHQLLLKNGKYAFIKVRDVTFYSLGVY